MNRLPFKNEHAIQRLSVGDTFEGDSGMGGSFTYTVTGRADKGLTLECDKGGDWENKVEYTWAEIKNNFYVLTTSPDYAVSLNQFLDVKKAGYTRTEEMADALKCSDTEVIRGLDRPVDVYTTDDREGEPIYFANKHDAKFVADRSTGLPPGKETISVENYLSTSVNQSIAEYYIKFVAHSIHMQYPYGTISAQQKRDMIESDLTAIFYLPESAKKDLSETVASEKHAQHFVDLFSRVIDKEAITAPHRAQEVLNNPDTFTSLEQPFERYDDDSLIHLSVNGEVTPFIHQKVHNQLFVLYNEELGMSDPNDTAQLKVLVDRALTAKPVAPKVDVAPATRRTLP